MESLFPLRNPFSLRSALWRSPAILTLARAVQTADQPLPPAPASKSRCSAVELLLRYGRLGSLSQLGAVLFGVLLTLVLAIADYYNGNEVAFSIFYLIPVAVAAWYVGRRSALALALAATLLWDYNLRGWADLDQAWGLIPVWNMGIRLASLAVVAELLRHWRRSLESERDILMELNQARTDKLMLKDRLLSHVSHELRTPLAAVHQFVTLPLDGLAGEVSPQVRECLEVAERNVRQLTRMVGDLLDASRSESGNFQIAIRPFDLRQTASEVLRPLASPASERGVKLIDRVPEDLPQALGDPDRVRQVIINLLDNALKFTPEGGRVELKAQALTDEGGCLRVTVTDNGPGIAAEAQSKVFQRLYQAETGDAAGRRGLGLGLFLCQELVTRQGGRIWLESELGKGSSFHFTLPLEAGHGR